MMDQLAYTSDNAGEPDSLPLDGLSADSVLLRAATDGKAREAAMRLLLMADVAEPHVRAWANEGEIFVLCDSCAFPGECPIGAVLIVPLGSGRTAELRLIAMAPDRRGLGLGRRMLDDLFDVLRARGVRQVVSSTSNADMGRMALFQKAGLRFSHVERDGCTPEHGWVPGTRRGGLPDRDLLWFELEL
jgi:GNAT superfamily N-acetyltransferase